MLLQNVWMTFISTQSQDKMPIGALNRNFGPASTNQYLGAGVSKNFTKVFCCCALNLHAKYKDKSVSKFVF